MLNKLLPKSPIGIALTAASVILALSPEARRMTRRAAVKGMAGVLSLVDQMKTATASTQQHISGFVDEARRSNTNDQERAQSFTYDIDVEPVAFTKESLTPFNVVNEEFVKQQTMGSQHPTH